MDKDKLVYQMLEIDYIKSRGRELSWDNRNEDLFPGGWYVNNDYKSKANILYEAIRDKKLIVDTSGYQNIVEGVRMNKRNN